MASTARPRRWSEVPGLAHAGQDQQEVTGLIPFALLQIGLGEGETPPHPVIGQVRTLQECRMASDRAKSACRGSSNPHGSQPAGPPAVRQNRGLPPFRTRVGRTSGGRATQRPDQGHAASPMWPATPPRCPPRSLWPRRTPAEAGRAQSEAWATSYSGDPVAGRPSREAMRAVRWKTGAGDTGPPGLRKRA